MGTEAVSEDREEEESAIGSFPELAAEGREDGGGALYCITTCLRFFYASERS